LVRQIDLRHTPKHGSWLNIADCELSALATQCLSRRIASLDSMRTEVHHWLQHRNTKAKPVQWRFDTTTARVKLRSLYPKF
ncbi:IS630 family transposase, partial [Verrucomicrobia bacterium LW23]